MYVLQQRGVHSLVLHAGQGVRRQIEEGIEFHRRRYRTASKYLVYFQSFSNTYAPLERLKEVYGEALAHPDVAGIVVGTRPDCVDAEKPGLFRGAWRAGGTWPSSTASNRPATRRCGR